MGVHYVQIVEFFPCFRGRYWGLDYQRVRIYTVGNYGMYVYNTYMCAVERVFERLDLVVSLDLTINDSMNTSRALADDKFRKINILRCTYIFLGDKFPN